MQVGQTNFQFFNSQIFAGEIWRESVLECSSIGELASSRNGLITATNGAEYDYSRVKFLNKRAVFKQKR